MAPRPRRGSVTLAAALLQAASLPDGGQAALSVMPHQTEGIVMNIRSSVVIDERDLTEPKPLMQCSSLDDGPMCVPFGQGGGEDRNWFGTSTSSGLGRTRHLDLPSSAGQFVVDGVLSDRVQSNNKEAFRWGQETFHNFGQLVTRVAGDFSGGKGEGTFVSWRGIASQCFRLAFNELPPHLVHVPRGFSKGLAKDLEARWTGLWEVGASGTSRPSRERHSRGEEEAEVPPWRSFVELGSAVGSLSFTQPVVLRRLLVAVRPQGNETRGWWRQGLLCGRVHRKERWCHSLTQVAARISVQDADRWHYQDLGSSLHSVDQLAFIGVPAGSLRIGLVEVSTTRRSQRRHFVLQAEKRVVLLKRSGSSASRVEPVLATVSRDAALWDMNQVLRHHMVLRPSRPPQKPASSSGSAPEEARTTMERVMSLQQLLRDVKAQRLGIPEGVSVAQLRREMQTLRDLLATRVPNNVVREAAGQAELDSILRDKLREEGLDGLLALQAAWRRAGYGAVLPATPAAPAKEEGYNALGEVLSAFSARPSKTKTLHEDPVQVEMELPMDVEAGTLGLQLEDLLISEAGGPGMEDGSLEVPQGLSSAQDVADRVAAFIQAALPPDDPAAVDVQAEATPRPENSEATQTLAREIVKSLQDLMEQTVTRERLQAETTAGSSTGPSASPQVTVVQLDDADPSNVQTQLEDLLRRVHSALSDQMASETSTGTGASDEPEDILGL